MASRSSTALAKKVQPVVPPTIDTKKLFSLYTVGEHEKLSEELLGALSFFGSFVYTNEKMVPEEVSAFLKVFLTLFTQPDYVIAEKHVIPFILNNTLLSNLVAMSHFRSTDAFLEILRNQPSNFVKILTLYSARNAVHFDRRTFFDANAGLASLWYNQFCMIYKSGLVREDVVRHMSEHLKYHDERMLPAQNMAEGYYGCSYVDGDLDRIVKPFLNSVVRRHIKSPVNLSPDPKKIAVISDFWYATHSVYRNYAEFVRELKKNYHLTLFHTITPQELLDVSMFDTVCRLDMTSGKIPVEQLSGNFQMVYFPDIGMSDPSIILSNCRIAPIQICSPGHSVSTWGADIDYFISGADVEIAKDPERNYSERLVLLPGMGAIHNLPQYKPAGITKKTSDIVINCPWAGHKICARFLSTLRRLLDQLEAPVVLRIFLNIGTSQNNAHVAFLRDLQAALGDNVKLDVHRAIPYADYMRLMEEGDLTLDCFHYAGCNSVVDSLFLRKPTLVWEGDKWYNRIGPAMLRLVGMDSLICTNEDEYIDKAVKLITDEKIRERVKEKLEAVDLDAVLFSTEHAPAFCRAVDSLIANHEEWKKQGSKAPILIS